MYLNLLIFPFTFTLTLSYFFLKLLFGKVSEIFTLLTDQSDKLIKSINKAIDKKQWEQGHLSSDRLLAILSEFKKQVLTESKGQFEEISKHMERIVNMNSNSPSSNTHIESRPHDVTRRCTFCYNGRFYHVPQDFQFPSKAKLKEGLKLWLHGQTCSVDGSLYIRPYTKINGPMLPSQVLKNKFKLHWKPVFSLLKNIEDILIPINTTKITTSEIDQIYNSFLHHLKNTVSYLWVNGKRPESIFSISTWAKKTRRSEVLRLGTANDILNLKEPTKFNLAGGRNNKQKKNLFERPLTSRRINDEE